MAKDRWIADIRDLGSRTSLALAKLGTLPDAVLALESTSAILLGQSLKMSQVQVDRLRHAGHAALADRFEGVRSWLSHADDSAGSVPTSFNATRPANVLRSATVIKRELDAVIDEIRTIHGYEDFLRPVQLGSGILQMRKRCGISSSSTRMTSGPTSSVSLKANGPDEKTYDDPEYWGAFSYNGIRCF